MTWFNSDGLLVRFAKEIGVRGNKAALTCGAGKRRELVLDVDLTTIAPGGVSYTSDLNNDGVVDGFTALSQPLPSGVRLDDIDVITVVTPAGGTSFAVGTFLGNGTVVSANGLQTTGGAAGAQIGTQTTAEWYVGVTIVGTYTAGKIKIVISYITQ